MKTIIINFFKPIKHFIVAIIIVFSILNIGIKLYHFSLGKITYNDLKSETNLSHYSYDQKTYTYNILKKHK